MKSIEEIKTEIEGISGERLDRMGQVAFKRLVRVSISQPERPDIETRASQIFGLVMNETRRRALIRLGLI